MLYMERGMYFQELAHLIVEAGEFKICSVGGRLETQGSIAA